MLTAFPVAFISMKTSDVNVEGIHFFVLKTKIKSTYWQNLFHCSGTQPVNEFSR